MKLDELLEAESPGDDGPLDDVIVNAMAALGFVKVSYRLTRFLQLYLGIITGHRADGGTMHWNGMGKTPVEAETNAIDELAKWIMQQQVGAQTP